MKECEFIELRERSKTSMNDFICELTEFMDGYVIDELKMEVDKFLHTYLTHNDEKNTMKIMFPGATRGYLVLDDNDVIVDVKLYKEQCFSRKIGVYKKSLNEKVILNRFKDVKLIIPKKENVI